MNALDQKIWDLVNNWCNQQASQIPDQNRRALMDLIKDLEPVEWMSYPENRPPCYGKYLIERKDGKIHWETYNGTGFAYNNTVIVKWMRIKIEKYEKA